MNTINLGVKFKFQTQFKVVSAIRLFRDIGIFDEDPSLEDSDSYSIKYEKDCDTYELFEKQQILYPIIDVKL